MMRGDDDEAPDEPPGFGYDAFCEEAFWREMRDFKLPPGRLYPTWDEVLEILARLHAGDAEDPDG